MEITSTLKKPKTARRSRPRKRIKNEGEMQRFKEWLDQFPITETTINKYVWVIRKFFSDGYDINDNISVNKFLKKHQNEVFRGAIKRFLKFKGIENYELIKIKRKKKGFDEHISIEKIREILEKLKDKNKDVYWVLKIASLTGARIHEILSLKVSNIGDDKIIFLKTKTGDKREVPVDPEIMKDLKDYIMGEKGLLGQEKCFFTNYKRIHTAYEKLRQYLDKYLEKDSEFLKKTHNFRRAVINWILEITNDNILAAQVYVGHSSPSTTERYASERTKERLKMEISEKISKIHKGVK